MRPAPAFPAFVAAWGGGSTCQRGGVAVAARAAGEAAAKRTAPTMARRNVAFIRPPNGRGDSLCTVRGGREKSMNPGDTSLRASRRPEAGRTRQRPLLQLRMHFLVAGSQRAPGCAGRSCLYESVHTLSIWIEASRVASKQWRRPGPTGFVKRAYLYAAALLLAVATARAQAAATPVLRHASCRAPVVRSERIECYILVVPENRHAPHSRTIDVPVTIVRSRSAHPAPDPLVYTEGGPGGRTIRDIVTGKPIFSLDHRDFVAIEQRGAGLSRPSLACNEYRDALYRLGLANRTTANDPAPLLAAANTCAKQYAGSGVDLAGYNTDEIADDVNDLRRTLHARQIDVYGISYSTRV